MSQYAIEEALTELAVVTEEIIAQADAADARAEKLSEASDAVHEQRAADGEPRCQPDPQRAIANLRETLAAHAAQEHRNAAREFAAWWADLATLAVLAAVTGRPVHPARAVAADPTIWFDEEDLRHLPEVPESVRELAGLAARMAAVPGGPQQGGDDMTELATDYAARAGLRFGHDDHGQIVAEQDVTPEARRCRLWGDSWTEARVPALPAPDELTNLLVSHGAPAPTIAAVAEVTRAVDDAVTALFRAQELERGHPGDESISTEEAEDIEALWSRADHLTALLGQYARTLTDTLPLLRTSDQPK